MMCVAVKPFDVEQNKEFSILSAGY
jgi:hypothetical protein